MPDGEQTELGLLVFIKTFTESDRSNLDFVCATLAMELPLDGFGCVTLKIVFFEEADTLVGVHRCEIFSPEAIITYNHAKDLRA
jgi:hypothetical protein